MQAKKNICCFIGHKKVVNESNLKEKINNIVENLISNHNVEIFMFGSKSQFNDLSYSVITNLKNKYPHIARVYVRAEYPTITKEYENYLLQRYECTYYPKKIINSGKAVYVERNQIMIDKSDVCVIYYNENNLSNNGTRTAYNYAKSKNKTIINTFK